MEPSNIQIRVLPDSPELLDSNSYVRVPDEDVEEKKETASQKNFSFGSNAPPNYDEGKESPLPPATSTMFRSVKRTGAAATRSYGLIKRVAAVFCCSVTIIVILAILMAIPVAMIIIGSINLKNCSLQKMVPIWLIVFGSLSIIKNLSTLIQRIKALKQKDEEQSSRTILNVFDSFMALFLIIWFICGNIWIYGNFNKVQSNDSSLDNYCDKLTFYFTFWIITAIYIVIIVSCLLFCCTVCFTIFLPPRK